MPLPSSHIKQELQYSYVHAVVAKAGAKFERTASNDYGSDGKISYVKKLPNGKYTDTSITFSCQLKATTTCDFKDNHVVYDIGVEAYNKLVSWEGFGFIILIVFNLPKCEEEWLKVQEDVFVLKHCCYWIRLAGEKSSNKSSERLSIPKNQLFDTNAVTLLLEEARIAARKSREVER